MDSKTGLIDGFGFDTFITRSRYSLGSDGMLNTTLLSEPVIFQGIPADRAVWASTQAIILLEQSRNVFGRNILKACLRLQPLCSASGLSERSIFTYAVTELADGRAVAAVLMCDSPHVKQTWAGTNLSAPSLSAFVSDGPDGRVWTWQGVIADARVMVPKDTVRGLTGEADIALLADGKTLIAVMRVDGDCTCGMARVGPEQQAECGRSISGLF